MSETETVEQEEKPPRHKILSRLRHPLGASPRNRPVSPAQPASPAPSEDAPPEVASSEEAAPEKAEKAQALRFHSSF